MLIKTLMFFTIIVYVQQVVLSLYENGSETYAKQDSRVVWLLYEVLIFYFNLLSLMIFLVFSRFKSFKTLREK